MPAILIIDYSFRMLILAFSPKALLCLRKAPQCHLSCCMQCCDSPIHIKPSKPGLSPHMLATVGRPVRYCAAFQYSNTSHCYSLCWRFQGMLPLYEAKQSFLLKKISFHTSTILMASDFMLYCVAIIHMHFKALAR